MLIVLAVIRFFFGTGTKAKQVDNIACKPFNYLKTIKGEVTNFLYFKDKSFLKYALIVATGGNLMILDIEGHSNVYYSHPVHCGLPLLYGLLKKIYPLKYGQMSPLQETH